MGVASEQTEWIAVDWGTSNLRIWVMDAKGRVVHKAASEAGMGTLTQAQFEPAFLSLAEPYLRQGCKTPVICCGMVGSRQGWAEAPYLSVPCRAPTGHDATRISGTDARITVYILPGVKQTQNPDVMRGEETQIAGFLRLNPTFDGVVCLPGTHTKWVHISAEEIVSFQTCMTGELFALLSGQSVLRHSVGGAGFDSAHFAAAIEDAISRPQALASELFGLRAGALLGMLDQPGARARLSGLLIGTELAATRPYWLGQNLVILGSGQLAENYRAGLVAQGVGVTMADVTEITLGGLRAAYEAIKETTK